jgi:hypothetical protein
VEIERKNCGEEENSGNLEGIEGEKRYGWGLGRGFERAGAPDNEKVGGQ